MISLSKLYNPLLHQSHTNWKEGNGWYYESSDMTLVPINHIYNYDQL